MNYHHVFEGHADRIFSLAVCTLADGSRYAASGSNDRTLRIWSLDTFQLVRVIECSDFVWRAFIVLCPRALVVAYISAEQKIQVWDLLTGEMVITFYGRLIFSGTISLFKQPIAITATGEEDVSFVDVCTGQTLYTLKGGFDKALRAVVSPAPHANLVFTTWNSQNRRSTIQSYELPDELPRSSSGRTSPTDIDRSSMSILFEGDSRDSVTSVVITVFNSPLLCSGHHDFQIRVWSLQTKQLLRILTGHSDYVGCVAAWKGNQPLIVSGASDGEVKVWNVHSGELVATGLGHTRDVWGLAVTAQSSSPYHNYNAHNPGRLLASNYTHYHQTQLPIIVTGSTDRTIRLWNINEMLMDRCWLRRKHFCLFLSYLGFLSAEGSSSAIIAFSNKYGLCGGDSSSGTKYSGSGDADITECGEVVFDCCISEVQSADGLRFGQLISRILESYILESFEKFDDSDLQQQTLDSMFFWQQSNSTEVSEEAADWPFDVQGMAPRQTLKLPGMNSANELILIGTGMRKVNLIVVAFDVYRIGIYASKSAVAKAIKWNKSHAEDYSLSMALVSNKAATSTERALDFSATLKFSRAVSKAEFLAAFNVSFYGCNEEDIASFINSLGHLIDDTGVLVGDEVTYYWFNNGDFAVGRGADKYEATNTTDEIRLRLLEVYIDPVRSVSFQLQECVHNNLDNLSSMKFLS